MVKYWIFLASLITSATVQAQTAQVAAFTSGGYLDSGGTVMALGQPFVGSFSDSNTIISIGIVPAVGGTGSCTGDFADDFGTLGADGQVSFGDFLALLGLIGPCPGSTPGCVGDIADDFGSLPPLGSPDGQVSFGDFLALLGLIGPCP